MLAGIRSFLRKENGEGTLWFVLATALPPLASVVLGPIILRKVGLEEYGVLGLSVYFLGLVTAYSDFGGNSHLIASWSKRDPARMSDLGNASALRFLLLAAFFLALAGIAAARPRSDSLYSLLALSMVALWLPSTFTDWYLIAGRQYRRFFNVRLAVIGVNTALLLAWFLSPWKSPLFIPAAGLCAGLAGSVYLLCALAGGGRLRRWLAALRASTAGGVRALLVKMLPLAAAQILTPYFLAYALAWFSMISPDKKAVGSFSIAYRLILGALALVGPFAAYSIPRFDPTKGIPLGRTLGISLAACAAFWILGAPILWLYFRVSEADPSELPRAMRVFSILMLGIFCVCLRTPYVGACLVAGRYRAFFLYHLISCAPIVLLSLVAGRRIPPEWVAWLSCAPDLLVTAIFIAHHRARWRGAAVG